MSDAEINDGLMLVLADTSDGGSVDRVGWPEARARLVAYLAEPNSAAGWAENEAEHLLCTIFSGLSESAGLEAA